MQISALIVGVDCRAFGRPAHGQPERYGAGLAWGMLRPVRASTSVILDPWNHLSSWDSKHRSSMGLRVERFYYASAWSRFLTVEPHLPHPPKVSIPRSGGELQACCCCCVRAIDAHAAGRAMRIPCRRQFLVDDLKISSSKSAFGGGTPDIIRSHNLFQIEEHAGIRACINSPSYTTIVGGVCCY